MGLRLSEGIEIDSLERRFEVPVVDWNRVERLTGGGHRTVENRRIRATPAGRLLLDSGLGEIAYCGG